MSAFLLTDVPSLLGPSAGRSDATRRAWAQVLLLVCAVVALTACTSTARTTKQQPVIVDPETHQFVNALAQKILRVSEISDRGPSFRVHLADLASKGAAGLSVGKGIVYIDYGIAKGAKDGYAKASQDRTRLDLARVWFLVMVLAHEIGHEAAGHAANNEAVSAALGSAQVVGSGLSYAPGVLGLVGAVVALGARASQLAYFYSPEQELEADRRAIAYWHALGWPCQLWVKRFEILAAKGIKGDARHPTEGRLEQARQLCSSGTAEPDALRR